MKMNTMNTSVEFLMWLAQNNPDCLNQHANHEDWGEKAFNRLYKQFETWRGEELPAESSILKVMQHADDTLAETDYNIGYLNGMERVLAVIQQRDPIFIPTERLKLPNEAMKLKHSISQNRSISKPRNGNSEMSL